MKNFLSNYTLTENAALTYRSTENAVLDFFSRAGAMRDYPAEALRLFEAAYQENPGLALKAAFWLRDIRGGAGERALYRNILVHLAHQEDTRHFFLMARHTPEFGTWEDIVEILDRVPEWCQHLIADIIAAEIRTAQPSLLYKWLPSENAGKRSKMLAKILRPLLHFGPKSYRRLLSYGRSRMYLVEHDMSAKRWDKIPYEKVPSRANLVYKDAFLRHDETRYINSLATIKSATIMPYELYKRRNSLDPRVLNAMWANLPDYMNKKNALVLADVSGSMEGQPMEVSVSLALYAAERTKGIFRNTFITFESQPSIRYIEPKLSVKDKMSAIEHAPWGGSTNLQAAFELILGIAVRDRVPQEQMPEVLFVISDMEFNQADRHYETNHEAVMRKYAEAGYRMPTLVYWNVNARNAQSPVTQHQTGAVLISGLSATLFKNVLNLDFNATYEIKEEVAVTPLEAMLQILNSERYNVL